MIFLKLSVKILMNIKDRVAEIKYPTIINLTILGFFPRFLFRFTEAFIYLICLISIFVFKAGELNMFLHSNNLQKVKTFNREFTF